MSESDREKQAKALGRLIYILYRLQDLNGNKTSTIIHKLFGFDGYQPIKERVISKDIDMNERVLSYEGLVKEILNKSFDLVPEIENGKYGSTAKVLNDKLINEVLPALTPVDDIEFDSTPMTDEERESLVQGYLEEVKAQWEVFQD